jgi:glycosyltransferase EpsE
MATYDCADTVAEALESVAAQTWTQWELVVCDDASTDDTVAVLEEFSVRHPGRVTILRNAENRRLSYSLNRCLDVATGEFVARMDGDDRCAPTRFETQVAYLREHPELHLVGTAMRRFDDEGPKDVVVLPASPDRWSMRRGVAFAHATVMVRREVYAALGGYTVSPRTVRGQDKDLWFRFFDAGFSGANLPQPLYEVREDAAAVRRRDLRTRVNTFRTSMYGYRLLGYPWHWYPGPLVELLKALVPVRGVLAYRRWQARRSAGDRG